MFSLLLAIIYLAFISLGLPDSLLGSAWPVISEEFSSPISYAGIVSMIISIGTIISSLLSDKITKNIGAGLITAISVGMTAVALLGFSFANSFIWLCILAVPYGLGAGGVDAALNNYVALHYKARHMNWLHSFWGVGVTISPYIMSFAIGSVNGWRMGYRIVSIIQMASAYTGSTFTPLIFGAIARRINISLYPFFLLIFGLLVLIMTEVVNCQKKGKIISN